MAKVLQERASSPFFLMDVDAFVGMAPMKFTDNDGQSVQFEFVARMFHAVRLFSDMGFNLVVPVIFVDGSGLLEDAITLLHTYPVLLVKVNCSVEELRRREEVRGNRKIGEAESLLPHIVPQNTYDIIVGTDGESKEACADRIIHALHTLGSRKAFASLWDGMQSMHNRA